MEVELWKKMDEYGDFIKEWDSSENSCRFFIH